VTGHALTFESACCVAQALLKHKGEAQSDDEEDPKAAKAGKKKGK